MKRKVLIVLGVLAFLVIIIWPAAPLWARLGLKPSCIQGQFPDLKIVSCPSLTEVLPAASLFQLPTPGRDSPIPVIVDDDGSPDGMVALLYFLRNPLFEVKAVTISCGEAHPDKFAPLVQRLLAGLDRADIPVGTGRATPLEGNNTFPDPWRQVSDDFWGITLPETFVTREPTPAAELIVSTIHQSNLPVMVFVSGTHTNLAEALRLDAGIANNIREVYIMGGSIHVPGNIKSDWPAIDNSVAEWNIWVDPVAAKEVFTSGLPLHLSPLDATNQVTWSNSDALSWIESGTPEGAQAGDLLQWMLESWGSQSGYIWDLLPAVIATDPALCTEIPLALDILTAPGNNQGQLVITDEISNVNVCLDPDASMVKSLVAAVLGH